VIFLLLALACKPDPAPAPVADAGADLTVTVGQLLDLNGSSSIGESFVWRVGDQTLDGMSVTTTIDAPGHLTAYLTVTNTDGETAQDTARVTVHYPPLQPAPTHSTPLAHSPGRLFAVLPDFDMVAVVDVATGQVEHVDVCGQPRTVGARDNIFVTACTEDALVAGYIDGASWSTEVFDMPRGSRPFGVALQPDGLGAFVTLSGTGQVAEPGGISGQAFDRFSVGPDVRGIALSGGKRLVTRWRSPDESGRVYNLAQSADSVPELELAKAAGPDSDTDARGLPSLLEQVVIRPDGHVAVVVGLKSNIDRGLMRDGLALTHETLSRSVLRQIDLVSYSTDLPEPIFDNRDHATAAAFSPLGDWLYVAHRGAQAIDILDSYTMARVGGLLNVGEGVDGLWVSADGNTLWVLASLARELVAYDVSDPTLDVELQRIDLVPPSGEVLGAQLLHGKQLFYAAVDPRITPHQYISCGTCHPEGVTDRRTWDFTDRGEGLRNTIMLAGRQGVSPLHWSANMDEVQDFEKDIRLAMAGHGLMDDADFEATVDPFGTPKAGLSADLDALAAYVQSLDVFPVSPYRNPDGSLTADGLAGQAIFESSEAGCTGCHVPPEYTDSAWIDVGVANLHDVGTLLPTSGERLHGELTGIDTPSLRGLHASAPYLHDGRAPTVLDALVPGMGDVSHLSATELTQLETFLLSIE